MEIVNIIVFFFDTEHHCLLPSTEEMIITNFLYSYDFVKEIKKKKIQIRKTESEL